MTTDRSWHRYNTSRNKYLTAEQIEDARRHVNKLMGRPFEMPLKPPEMGLLSSFQVKGGRDI